MTSQINPNNIDGTYPVAGQANNTQGFRDNFTNIKTNFSYAEDEITELQSKAILKSALSGTTLDNNMSDNLIYAVKMNDVSFTALNLTATSGSINLDYAAAAWQTLTMMGNCSLGFTNWPASGSYGVVNLEVVVTNTAYTLTLPTSVVNGLLGLAGWDSGTRTITFYQTGSYRYSFSSVDGGTEIQITDFDRPRNVFFSQLVVSNTTPSTSTTTGALVVSGGAGIGANLNVGGDFVTYNANNTPVFSAYAANGFVQIASANIPANTAGALNIVGTSDGSYQPVTGAGGMIHVTGNGNITTKITVDGFGSSGFASIVGRAARGTAAVPTPTQTNDVMLRISALGYAEPGYNTTSTGGPPTSIDFVATDNYTANTYGSKISFYTSPQGTGNIARTLSATLTSTVATFPANVSVTGNVNTGNISLTGNVISSLPVTGNITGGNITSVAAISGATISTSGNIISGGNILANDGGAVGYTNGAGGTVSQTGNKSTGVTLNKLTGEITMQATNLASDTSVSFTLTNSTIGDRDLLLMNIVGGVATPGTYNLDANCTSGSAVISVRNITGGTLGEAIVIRYAVIRGTIA